MALREILMQKIDEIHTKEPALGRRKILKQLRKDGYTVGRKLVRRLMQDVPYLLRNVSVQLFIPFSPAYPGINHVNNAQNLAKYG